MCVFNQGLFSTLLLPSLVLILIILLYRVFKNIPVRSLGRGSKQEIAL
jgi:hypothetical protein